MSVATTSPRLPSPPPPAEDQTDIGPKSPEDAASLQAQSSNRHTACAEQSVVDVNARRRIRRGTKAEDMAAGPPLVPLNELDSPFQLQEHLAALHYHHTASATRPITRETARLMATPPPGIDRLLWLYELSRLLIAKCNSLIIGFFSDTPPCSQETCPEMRASEWQFLCAVHEQPKSCCAIDYCCHTLDWAANVVTNPRLFPSRFVVMPEGHDKNGAHKNLVNVFRRLHRIIAHAWFQHQGVFWSVEAQTGLYILFKGVCDYYALLPTENFKLPPEAEGLEQVPEEGESQPEVTAIEQPPVRQEESGDGEDDQALLAPRSNTARHSNRPSVGSVVSTVIEEREEDNTEIASDATHLDSVEVPVVEQASEDTGEPGTDEDAKPEVEADSDA